MTKFLVPQSDQDRQSIPVVVVKELFEAVLFGALNRHPGSWRVLGRYIEIPRIPLGCQNLYPTQPQSGNILQTKGSEIIKEHHIHILHHSSITNTAPLVSFTPPNPRPWWTSSPYTGPMNLLHRTIGAYHFLPGSPVPTRNSASSAYNGLRSFPYI